MIHQTILSELTRERLTDVLILQLRLLLYAAGTESLDQSDCATYLDRRRRFRGRGTDIAAWIWRSPRKHKPLKKFAQHTPVREKQDWVRCLIHEALRFLRRPTSLDSLTPFVTGTSPPWQKAGADFLRRFYDNLGSRSRFPKYCFSEESATSFSRQNFLEAFAAENQELHVCAACDESSAAEIDHYLPKSRYPHLACHPFNLIPICPLCNNKKSSADPLRGPAGAQRRLGDILLPYREAGLGSRTYLEVTLGKTITHAKFGPLKPFGTEDLRQRIQAFGSAYKIPKHWCEKRDTIGQKLIRHIRSFLRSGSGPPLSTNLQAVLDDLDVLLHSLHDEARGKEPFAFAMTWWLRTLINQEVEPAVHNRSKSNPLHSFRNSLLGLRKRNGRVRTMLKLPAVYEESERADLKHEPFSPSQPKPHFQ